jgi:hypothetical protein
MPTEQHKAGYDRLAALTLLYLGAPMVLFLAGWIRPVLGVVSIIPLAALGFRMARAWPEKAPVPGWRGVMATGVFSLGIAWFLGAGAFNHQDWDWVKHNAVLFDCTRNTWPVVLHNNGEEWGLVYYVGYYLPAALAGKFTGYLGARVTLCLWTGLGVLLTCLWFSRATGWSPLPAAVGFFLFCGLDAFGWVVTHGGALARFDPQAPEANWSPIGPRASLMFVAHHLSNFSSHMQNWGEYWEFPSHFFMLSFSPGQAIAGWLSAALYLDAAPPQRLPLTCLLFTIALVWSPLVAAGFIVFAGIIWLGDAGWRSLEPVRQTFWLLAATAIPFAVMGAYYASKMSPDLAARYGRVPAGWWFRARPFCSPGHAALMMALFAIIEFGAWVFVLRRCFAPGSPERRLAVCCGVALAALLPARMGLYNDLAMRGSIAALFGLAVLAARALRAQPQAKWTRLLLVICAVTGALTPTLEAINHARASINERINPTASFIPPVSGVLTMKNAEGLEAQYLGSTQTFFFRHLAAKRGGRISVFER